MKQSHKLFYFFLIVFICAVGFGIYYVKTLSDNTEIYQAVQTKTVEHPEKKQKKETVDIPIDFKKLKKINEDIYAWIEIPDTAVNYPIVQSADSSDYYLNHTIERKEGFPGSIYTENVNAKDFQDKNTVIYGHNMRNGTMFSSLNRFVDRDYMDEHSLIYIYTPEHKLTYEVFAAVTYDNRHIMWSFDFTKEEQFQAYLDSLYGIRNMNTYIRDDVEVTTEDRIITLSTCNGNDEQRLLVEAVLKSEE